MINTHITYYPNGNIKTYKEDTYGYKTSPSFHFDPFGNVDQVDGHGKKTKVLTVLSSLGFIGHIGIIYLLHSNYPTLGGLNIDIPEYIFTFFTLYCTGTFFYIWPFLAPFVLMREGHFSLLSVKYIGKHYTQLKLNIPKISDVESNNDILPVMITKVTPKVLGKIFYFLYHYA